MKSSGFSLIEVLVAVALFAFVILTMVAIQQTAFRNQSATIGRTALDNNATMAERVILRTLDSASVVQVPPQPSVGGAITSAWSLVAGQNVSPIDGGPLDPTLAQTYFFFCVNNVSADRSDLLLFTGAWPMPPTLSCSSTSPAPLLVAGGLKGMTISDGSPAPPIFTRPSNSVLQINYTFNLAQAGQPPLSVTHRTQMTLQGPLQTP